MGSLEDDYAKRGQHLLDERRRIYCAKVREVGPLLAPAIAHFKANPPMPFSMGWFLIKGETRVAWSVGSYGDCQGDIYLLPEGVFIATSGRSGNHDHPQSDYKVVDLTLSPGHAIVEKQEIMVYAIIRSLKSTLAPPPPPPRRRRRDTWLWGWWGNPNA